MRSILILILATLAGLVLGSAVNMALITVGPSIIPPPEGINMDNLEDSIHLFKAQHFIFPFLAHALGTLVGSFLGSLLIKKKSLRYLPFLIISLLFLIGGVLMVIQLPAPLWFEILDLILAYLPMGWFGYLLANRIYK